MTTAKPSHRQFNDLEGRRFGRLFVSGYAGKRGQHQQWACQCDCGASSVASASNLLSGQTTSCGCFHRERTGDTHRRHGMMQTPEWKAWASMRSRCRSKHPISFKHYGARGIGVCERWGLFENFLADMGPKPTPRHTIEREDNAKGYEPGNCRWATPDEQSRNTSRNRRLRFMGNNVILSDLARIAKTSHTTIADRLARGIDAETAVAMSGVYVG